MVSDFVTRVVPPVACHRESSGFASPMAPHRIVFVEASVGGVLGGSLTGILQLIDRMDRRRFTPVLVLFETKDIVPALRANGVAVHVLPPLPDPFADGDRGRVARAWLRMRELA